MVGGERMGKLAFIYPGQGAQKVGMGKDFYEKSNYYNCFIDIYIHYSFMINGSV